MFNIVYYSLIPTIIVTLFYSFGPTLFEAFLFGTRFKKVVFNELNKVEKRINQERGERVK